MTRGCPRLARIIFPALLTLTLLVACRSGAATPTPAAPAATPSALTGSPTSASSAATPTRFRLPTATQATPVTVTQTAIEVIKPVDASGLVATYRRTDSVVGNCLGPSLVTTARADAWRCVVTADSTVLDPCFSYGSDRQPALFCFRQPWLATVTLMVLSAPLPDGRPGSGDPTTPQPWGIELADGGRCTLAAEPPPPIAGQAVSATCADGRSTLGAVDRSQPAWSILVVRDRNSQPQRIQIAKAWY